MATARVGAESVCHIPIADRDGYTVGRRDFVVGIRRCGELRMQSLSEGRHWAPMRWRGTMPCGPGTAATGTVDLGAVIADLYLASGLAR